MSLPFKEIPSLKHTNHHRLPSRSITITIVTIITIVHHVYILQQWRESAADRWLWNSHIWWAVSAAAAAAAAVIDSPPLSPAPCPLLPKQTLLLPCQVCTTRAIRAFNKAWLNQINHCQ
jgi:hypothetical protein